MFALYIICTDSTNKGIMINAQSQGTYVMINLHLSYDGESECVVPRRCVTLWHPYTVMRSSRSVCVGLGWVISWNKSPRMGDKM